jgi:hypothetical protein
LLTSLDTKATGIAFLGVYPYNTYLLIPSQSIPIANRNALLALSANQRSIYPFSRPHQDLDSGSSRIELTFMKKGASLFTHTAASTFPGIDS